MNTGGSNNADIGLESSCARILTRHRDKIKIKKAYLALANLSLIVDSFLKLSVRKGFHAMSLRDLAHECQLSMGGLYSYFDSKDTLLLMVLTEVAELSEELMRSADDLITQDPREHLRWFIRTHIEMTEKMRPWFVFAYMEAKSFPPSAKKTATDSELATEKILSEILCQGNKTGYFYVREPDFMAALIKPLLQDWYIKRKKYRSRGIGPAEYAEKLIEFIESSICTVSSEGKAKGQFA